MRSTILLSVCICLIVGDLILSFIIHSERVDKNKTIEEIRELVLYSRKDRPELEVIGRDDVPVPPVIRFMGEICESDKYPVKTKLATFRKKNDYQIVFKIDNSNIVVLLKQDDVVDSNIEILLRNMKESVTRQANNDIVIITSMGNVELIKINNTEFKCDFGVRVVYSTL